MFQNNLYLEIYEDFYKFNSFCEIESESKKLLVHLCHIQDLFNKTVSDLSIFLGKIFQQKCIKISASKNFQFDDFKLKQKMNQIKKQIQINKQNEFKQDDFNNDLSLDISNEFSNQSKFNFKKYQDKKQIFVKDNSQHNKEQISNQNKNLSQSQFNTENFQTSQQEQRNKQSYSQESKYKQFENLIQQ